MRKLACSSLLALVIALAGACGDDSGAAADGAIADAAGDGGVGDHGPVGDRGPIVDHSGDLPSVADRGPANDWPWPFDLPPGSGPNSGAICSASKPCVSSQEECTYFGSSTGMCLSPCANKGDACHVANPNTQVSTCATRGLDPNQWFCGWFCLLGGKTYQCPNSTDYQCVPSGTDGFSFCRPK